MNNILKNKKYSEHCFYSVVFVILSLIFICNIFSAKKKNNIDIDNNKYILYEKNKNIDVEKKYVDSLYDKYTEDVRMPKAKRIQKFHEDNEKGKIGMLDAISRNKIIMRFRDSVIVGDSIAQQVLYMIFKDEYYVKAKRGVAIPKMGSIIDEALERNPKKLIFLKGLNDAGYYRDVNEFIYHYEILINDILERRPDIKIYICSVLPPSEELLKSNGSLATWDIQNHACKDMCERKGINYVDTLFLFEENAEMRNPDGMHYTIQYYDKWLQYMDIVLNY